MLIFLFGADICKVVFLVTIIICNSISITISFLFLFFQSFIGVVASCQGVIPFPSFPKLPFLILLVFLILLILLQKLHCIGMDRLCFFGLESFRAGRILGGCFLALHFQNSAVGKAVTLGAQISESRTMMLDFRLALAFVLTALCTISLKFMDSWSFCFISTLMEGLRFSWK